VSRNGSQSVLDLFCGAGGLSLGFENAGFDVIAGVDNDEDAVETYRRNHEGRAIQCDLANTRPEVFAETHDIEAEDVDGTVGGPPCQGFSSANNERHVNDERNNLVFAFVDYVRHYEPEWFLMENVTGLKGIDDGETLELLVSDFEGAGYTVDWTILNAADYGVPQKRRRLFVQGQRDGSPTWPEPTHAPPKEIEDIGEKEAEVTTV
jgi:DNA (cytosine-5)-methyltransferase 1